MKTENNLPLQGDLEKFVKGELAIHIENSKEYVGLISHLEKAGIKLSNNTEYQKSRNCYDSQYPYFYMELPEDLYMNANRRIENIIKNYSITEFVKYSDLDFVKLEKDRFGVNLPFDNYYVTFGSDEQFPYPNQYLVINAPSKVEAQEVFRIFYPDRHENTLNYSFMYSEEEWEKMQINMKCAGSIEASNGLATVLTIDRFEKKSYHDVSEVITNSRSFEAILGDINDRMIYLRTLAGCDWGNELAEEINGYLHQLSGMYEDLLYKDYKDYKDSIEDIDDTL